MQDLPNGGGGRRSKHWPPGAGNPRYATGLLSYTDQARIQVCAKGGGVVDVCV